MQAAGARAPCPSGGRGSGSWLRELSSSSWLADWGAGGCTVGGRQLPLETCTSGGSGSPSFFSLPQGLWVPLLPLLGPGWSLVGAGLPLARRADPFCPPLPQEAYNAVVRYFGESPKTTPPSVFFPVFVRFIRSYKVSRREVSKEESGSEKSGSGERAGLQVWAFFVSSSGSWEGWIEAGCRPLSCELVGRVGAQALPVIVWGRKCPSRGWPPGVAGPTDTHSPPSVSAPPLIACVSLSTHTHHLSWFLGSRTRERSPKEAGGGHAGEAAGSRSQETGCQGGWDQGLGPGEQGKGLGGGWSRELERRSRTGAQRPPRGPDAGVHRMGRGTLRGDSQAMM